MGFSYIVFKYDLVESDSIIPTDHWHGRAFVHLSQIRLYTFFG